MATIIEQYDALDGWDVVTETELGRRIYHFHAGQPEDAQAAVNALEQAEIDNEAARRDSLIEVEAEDGTIIA